MRSRNLILAALAALAASACSTMSSDGSSAAAATPSSTRPASAVPATSWTTPGESLHDRVHDALMVQMGPAVNDVGVHVDGSAVFLTGSVHSQADKERAHAVAHGVAGASSVDISGLAVRP